MKRLPMLTKCAIFSMLTGLTGTAFASGFQLWEQGIGTGDYHAGAAAEADDASLEFYNAAQITELKHTSVSLGGVVIPISTKFNGRVDGDLSSGRSNALKFIPNFHFVTPLTNRLYFAFGVTTPFGLETDYGNNDATGATKFAATKTQMLTLNLNPSLAFKVASWFSVAVGFDALYGDATYANHVAFIPFNNELHGWGYGYNLGTFFKFPIFKSEPTKLGISYRSGVTVHAHGPSEYNNTKTTAKANLNLPSTTIISLYQGITPRWSVMASAFYTKWNVFSDLTIDNTAIPIIGPDITVHENYRNTWNFAFGTHIKLTKALTWKLGGGYDQTPTRTGYRDIRLPDVSRWAASTGFRWQATKSIAVETGFTHLFAPTAKVDNSAATHGLPVPIERGTAKVSANVIGLQLTWAMQ